MDMDFVKLVEVLKKFKGVEIINANIEPFWLYFICDNTHSLNLITQQINKLQDHQNCNVEEVIGKHKTYYQIIIDSDDKELTVKMIVKQLEIAVETPNTTLITYKEEGIPDLSLVTIHQMATELKRRKNLTFALVWMETNEVENIAIEGTGNPTQLVGLLTRGTHLAVKWADKNIKYDD